MNYKIGDKVIVKQLCYGQTKYSEWDLIALVIGDVGEIIDQDTVIFKNKNCTLRLNWNYVRPISPLEKLL